MVSITPVCASASGSSRERKASPWRHWLRILSLGLSLFCAPAQADDFTIRGASTELSEQVYLLHTQIEYPLTAEVLEALTNGVPITFRLDIEVERGRRWWLNETVASLEQRFQLAYHALSEQYVLRNLNSGALYTYPSLGQALDAMGTINDFPLLDAKLVEPDQQYQVELRSRLEIESLPAPLRPIAYLTPAWRLSSDWYTCSLKP